MPKVAVIIPNYCHAPYLKWRIDTVLGQTFTDFEVLILDDCSTDNSAEVLELYSGRENVQIEYNQENSGSVFRQWQKGIEKTDSEYVWIAESDDWAELSFLETLVPVLDSQPSSVLAYCQSWIADPEFNVTGNAFCWTEDLDPNRWSQNYTSDGKDEIRQFLSVKNTIPNASAVLQRRSVLEQCLPIESQFRLCGDWLHWVKMLSLGDVSFVSQSLNYWRESSSNARTKFPGVLEWEEGEGILDKIASILEMSDEQKLQMKYVFLEKCWFWLKEATIAQPVE